MKNNLLITFKNLFSFETVFVLFLFSYQYKNAHPIFLNPDITTVLAFTLLPWSYLIWRKEKAHAFWQAPIITLLMLSLGMYISLKLSPFPPSHYSKSKFLVFIIFTIPAFIFAYHVIGPNKERLNRLFHAFIIFAVFVHGAAYLSLLQGNLSIGYVLGNNYLITGQTLGVGFIFMTVLSFEKSESLLTYQRAILYLLWGSFAFIGLNLGGRGPILATIGALSFFYAYQLFTKPDKRSVLQHLLSVLLASIGGYWLLKITFALEGSFFYERLSSIAHQNQIVDATITLRLDYYKSAWQAFCQHPFIGVGLGKWPLYFGMGDQEWHPHNIFVEVTSEMGLLGLGLFSAFIGSVFWSFKTVFKPSINMRASTTLLIFSFLNCLKSGDLNDNILFFVALGLVAGQKKELLEQ